MRPRNTWLRHVSLTAISVIMLIPFYWVIKTAVTDENIYAYPPRLLPESPHLFNFVDVWYLIPFQATIIPAYLITAKLGLLNSYVGLALPLLSTIVSIFVFKAAFEAVPASLIDAARIDGLGEGRIIFRVLMPLSKAAVATNVVLSFIWSWNAFLWPLIITREPTMQTLPLGLARFLSYLEDTTGALYAFAVMVLAPSIFVFLMAQKEFIRGLTSGATKG